MGVHLRKVSATGAKGASQCICTYRSAENSSENGNGLPSSPAKTIHSHMLRYSVPDSSYCRKRANAVAFDDAAVGLDAWINSRIRVGGRTIVISVSRGRSAWLENASSFSSLMAAPIDSLRTKGPADVVR